MAAVAWVCLVEGLGDEGGGLDTRSSDLPGCWLFGRLCVMLSFAGVSGNSMTGEAWGDDYHLAASPRRVPGWSMRLQGPCSDQRTQPSHLALSPWSSESGSSTKAPS